MLLVFRKPCSPVFVLLTLFSVMSHVSGCDLAISSIDFKRCPLFLFLSQPSCSISSFVLCSVRRTFIICLYIHISNTSSRRISSFLESHLFANVSFLLWRPWPVKFSFVLSNGTGNDNSGNDANIRNFVCLTISRQCASVTRDTDRPNGHCVYHACLHSIAW